MYFYQITLFFLNNVWYWYSPSWLELLIFHCVWLAELLLTYWCQTNLFCPFCLFCRRWQEFFCVEPNDRNISVMLVYRKVGVLAAPTDPHCHIECQVNRWIIESFKNPWEDAAEWVHSADKRFAQCQAFVFASGLRCRTVMSLNIGWKIMSLPLRSVWINETPPPLSVLIYFQWV